MFGSKFNTKSHILKRHLIIFKYYAWASCGAAAFLKEDAILKSRFLSCKKFCFLTHFNSVIVESIISYCQEILVFKFIDRN